MADSEPVAIMGGQVMSGLMDCTSDLAALDSTGRWAVLVPFDGPVVCARFAEVRPYPVAATGGWPGLRDGAVWRTSLDEATFTAGVTDIRRRIAAGDVYQVNLTRLIDTPLPADADVVALGTALARHHPAPFAATLRVPGTAVASASPELFLRRRGRTVWSSPIKGTAVHRNAFLDKDWAENVMIVDLVRNDLGRVCEWGSVRVPTLCGVEEHPGLAHLVSTVRGELRPDVGWADLLEATFPPGSITGAPKLAALGVIAELEPTARGPYCGALGWVDADRATGELNVAIRTFWFDGGRLWFGTGGGITWGSDPAGEWAETELKAARLLQVAATAVG
jgi:para-aminobenzoate synthetase component 1